ncbi:conserved hypothetical protein (plasmid) [Methanohalobium evestigatum Z-7303]|uniref:Glycosyltransferase RgtA/B/C/D-like domain-containing protein n=1 Tax=Methanohalobium evestigatum (strain ATCC BAA-1072 / DSM 3721 / NBRC 107634 / OCM 161 / Z-7303) TaxID=644295 RepID=D7EBY2_METEZ|nr:hypothetical protein [Methanohalobium evestigatum]ADI75104.1 conserved hypothetical protein [Methanohalobium evestigatum Z-7303]
MNKIRDRIINYFKTFDSHLAIKIVSLLGFILLLIALFTFVKIPPADNYEFSLYKTFPWYFWLLVILCVFIGQSILVFNSYLKVNIRSWVYGYLLLFLSNSILLVIPFSRYFTFGRGDVLTHIGYMLDIEKYFNIGSNHYPANHLLGSILNYYTDLGFTDIVMIIPPLFSLFFVLSWYILGKQIFKKNATNLLILSLSSILSFGMLHVLFTPFHQSTLLIPFVLYLFFRTNNTIGKYQYNYSIFSLLLITFCVFIVFYHPLTTLILIVIFLLLRFASAIQYKLLGNKELKIRMNNLVLIIFIVFSMWSSYLYIAVNKLKPIFASILGTDETHSQLEEYVSIINYSDANFYQLAEIFVFKYGVEAILGFFSIMCMIVILKAIKKRDKNIYYYHIFSIIGFALFSSFSFLILITNISFSFLRIYTYSELFSLILIPSTFYYFFIKQGKIFKKINTKQISCILLCIILILFSILSIYSLYLSPLTKTVNSQVTEAQFLGMETFYQNQNDSYNILELGISQYRYYEAIFGERYPEYNVKRPGANNLKPIEHFNYVNGTSFGTVYNDTYYFLLNDIGRNVYPEVHPEFREKWKFTPTDFDNLNYDCNIDKIYTNKELDIFIINE